MKLAVISLNVVSLILASSFMFIVDIPEEPFSRIMGLSVADSNLSYINESVFGLAYLLLVVTLIINIRMLIKYDDKKEDTYQ